VLHVDETGLRVNGKNGWIHNAGNSEFTFNTFSPKRGIEGIEANGVLENFSGTVVHDCWKPYFKYDQCRHALCGAHLLRELNGVIENTGQHWATEIKALICEMKEFVDLGKRDEQKKLVGLSDSDIKQFYEKYDAILAKAELECPRAPNRKQSKARNLIERFVKYKTEITRFATDFNVPFDNNQAERDIRNVKGKMKVAGGFRTKKGAQTFARISSIIDSAKKQTKNITNIIKNIFKKQNLAKIATE
jgi:transposase